MAAAAARIYFSREPFGRRMKSVCCAVTCGKKEMLVHFLKKKKYIGGGGTDIQAHPQKALQQMNLLLHNVVSDITGVTGMKILKAMLAGERDPQVLA